MSEIRPAPPLTTPAVEAAQAAYHADTLRTVASAVGRDAIVVVGMGWNPFVGRARRLLTAAGLPHTYLGFGNYLFGWRKRLAIKLWSGWPTFPQVFVHGRLVGGASDLRALMERGELAKLVDAGRA
jgi:glutaredoxin-related protein